MPVVDLTDRFCATAKPTEGEDRTPYVDRKNKGLEFLVYANGRKNWYWQFTSPKDHKRARLPLGSYPATALAVARRKRLEAKALAEDGKDPRDFSHGGPAMTVADLIASHMDKHVRPLKSARHKALRFSANVTPVIGPLALTDLHRRDFNRVIDPILARNCPTQAGHVYRDLKVMFKWAVARGDLDRNPMEGMAAPSQSAPRERVLSDDEIRILWNGLSKSLAKSKACQRIVKLCLATAQRVGEVAGMGKDELDLPARLWSLPGSRTKNGHGHTVPLSDLAIGIIKEALADAGDGPYVFPTGAGSLPPSAVSRTVGRAQEAGEQRPRGRFGIAHFTTHDLRRTALTGMARLGILPTVLGYVANHRTVTRGGITMGVYVHYEHDREKRQALELWADQIEEIVANDTASIIPLARRG